MKELSSILLVLAVAVTLWIGIGQSMASATSMIPVCEYGCPYPDACADLSGQCNCALGGALVTCHDYYCHGACDIDQ